MAELQISLEQDVRVTTRRGTHRTNDLHDHFLPQADGRSVSWSFNEDALRVCGREEQGNREKGGKLHGVQSVIDTLGKGWNEAAMIFIPNPLILIRNSWSLDSLGTEDFCRGELECLTKRLGSEARLSGRGLAFEVAPIYYSIWTRY